MEEATKTIMREFDLTVPRVQNSNVVNWDVSIENDEAELVPFSHMILRRLWAHYRRTHIDSELTKKYNKNISDLPALDHTELKWYISNNFDNIFDNFLRQDVTTTTDTTSVITKPLYLVFCLESGDEILTRRVLSDEEDPYFQIINCEFSRLAGTFSRNQLGPIRVERDIPDEMISIFISTVP